MTITQPTLLLDKARCLRNIQLMKDKADRNNVVLRPHFKTHQSKTVGQWMRDTGITKCTVSTLDMALFFAEDGWDDITVAFPINILEIEKINNLADQITLNVLIEDKETLLRLDAALDFEINAFIKIDTGYGRTGIPIEKMDRVDELINAFDQTDLIVFKGFLNHAGHSYKCRSHEEIFKIHEQSKSNIQVVKNKYPKVLISTGDTPTCSVAEDFTWCDEMRPGNFVFYDLAQWQINSCELDQIAVAIACPVVAKHKDRNQIIVYGGGAHFGKDRIILPNGLTVWGLVVNYDLSNDLSWSILDSENWMTSLSQEHGIVNVDNVLFDNIEVGDVVTILPIHSCMTALAMREYLTTDGELVDHL